MGKKPQMFRANVGVVLMNGRGRVLALERADVPGAWQLPQGGLDEGEEPREAALRELIEETGVDAADLTVVAEHPDWLAYELPEAYRRPKVGRGQVQKWFLMRYTGADEIDLTQASDDEFSAWKWTTLRELAGETIWFRRPIYETLASFFSAHLAVKQ